MRVRNIGLLLIIALLGTTLYRLGLIFDRLLSRWERGFYWGALADGLFACYLFHFLWRAGHLRDGHARK